MASCVRYILTKNYQNLIINFQVTVKNVGDVYLRHSVVLVFSLDVHDVRPSFGCRAYRTLTVN